MTPSVTIISVNYNGGSQNLKLLKSLQKINYPKNRIKTIMVDNNSTDGSSNLIATHFPKTKLLKLKENIGYGPAINKAIRSRKSDYYFILNNDIQTNRQVLKKLIQFHQKNPDIGIIGPKLITNVKNRKSAQAPTFNFFTGAVKMNSTTIKKPQPVQWVQGCAMLIPSSTFKKIGLFDENFSKIYFEDLDLCIRTQKAGLLTFINPQAICYHYQSYTINKIPLSQKWFYWHKNKILFLIKHASLIQILTSLCLTLIAGVYWNLFKRQPHLKSLLKAIVWNAKNLHTTLKSKNAIP